MAEIDTYAPRKVTPQNKDLLPSTHDPKKRTTYVHITLNEDEIKEAVRNYIRAQVPISDEDELPVDLIAGRGDNGHSAAILVTAPPVTVTSPERPTAPMATFDEAAADAARRNGGTVEVQVEPVQVDIEEAIEAAEPADSAPESEPADAGEPEPEATPADTVAAEESVPEEVIVPDTEGNVTVVATETEEGVVLQTPQEAATEAVPETATTPAEEPATPVEEAPAQPERKKSSLFDAPAQTAPAETPAEPQTAPEPAPEKKSIFDL